MSTEHTSGTLAEDQPIRLSLRVVAASIVGMWLCYFVLITLRGSIVGLEMQYEMLWRRAVVSLAGVVVTFGLWQVIRLFQSRTLVTKIAVVLIAALPAALIIAQVNQVVFAPLGDKMAQKMGEKQGANVYRDEAGNLLVDVPAWRAGGPTTDDTRDDASPNDGSDETATFVIEPAPTHLDRWQRVTDIAIGRYFLLLAWASLYLALLAGVEAREAERRGERFRTAAKAAELRSLRYQVNPHFLFNALNSLSALVMTGKADRAEQMIQTISRFYRHSLADDPTGDVSLEDELDLQEHYLDIEAVRFPERLRIKGDCPRELMGYQVPGMILQPLVENSVKYGVSASTDPVTISIVAREDYGRLVLTVSDDGPGAAAGSGKNPNGGFGIGLANVRDRLVARFGKEASIVSGPTLDGYETEMRMPLVKHG